MRETIPTHVWVDVTGKWADHSGPGIVLMWRKGRNGWEGWCVYASTYSTGSGLASYVTQAWVQAHHIRKADTTLPSA
jgi:hypothetical protein